MAPDVEEGVTCLYGFLERVSADTKRHSCRVGRTRSEEADLVPWYLGDSMMRGLPEVEQRIDIRLCTIGVSGFTGKVLQSGEEIPLHQHLRMYGTIRSCKCRAVFAIDERDTS